MRVADLARAMEIVAPTRFAAAWDNVGLLVGDPEGSLGRILLAIDCTRAVIDEARAGGFDAIVAYHPPIFEARKRFVAGLAAYEAARAGLAVYSPHTALDVAEGGTNDVLADLLGMTDRSPLRAAIARDAETKLVTFVPASHVDAVARAVFEAGAGHIGDYSSCSFRTGGTGTFRGDEGTHPAVGQAGRLEEVAEVRLETVVAAGRMEAVVRALRAAHPYEEPAFDLVPLAVAAASGGRGFGRVGTVEPETVARLVDRVKRGLGVDAVLLAGPADRTVTRAAVCAGSGGDLVPDAVAAGATLMLTGEVRHHDALRALEGDLAIVCTRHSTSERAALRGLERKLRALLPAVEVSQSENDGDPFRFA